MAEREFEESDAIFKEILKIVRLIMYIILFCAILGGAVANRLSLLLIISGINKVIRHVKGSNVNAISEKRYF